MSKDNLARLWRVIIAGSPARITSSILRPDAGFGNWRQALQGYGVMTVNGKAVGAHLVYYRRHKGAVPKGLQLDHLCNTRLCVNPDHLEPVTFAENIRRARERTPWNSHGLKRNIA